MRLDLTALVATGFLAGLMGAASAADPVDPDWPCVQRRIEHLSIGAMWPHPLPDDSGSLAPDLEEVAAQLALRRVSEEEAQNLLATLAADRPEFGLTDYGRLFAATFDHIDDQRASIVQGIGRYARSQAQLAQEIDELQAEMQQLEAAEDPDFDRLDVLEAEVDGRIRVFRDRDRVLTYVCESPVLLEQRAFSLARMMLAVAE